MYGLPFRWQYRVRVGEVRKCNEKADHLRCTVTNIDEIRSKDGPWVTPAWRTPDEGRSGDLIMAVQQDSSGVWRVAVRIELGRNVPHSR